MNTPPPYTWTTPEPTGVEPFSILLAFFVTSAQWRVVTCLTRARGDLHPHLEVWCGDRLRVQFFWDQGYMSFKVTYAIDDDTMMERRGRVGIATAQTLCRLDPDWYDLVREAVAKILADLTGHRDGLQATLASLASDKRDALL